MNRAIRSSKAGLSLLEVVLSMALFGVVAHQGFMVMTSVGRSSKQETTHILVEDRAQSLLDKIAQSIMGSSRTSLDPGDAEAPMSTDFMSYQVYLGIEDGVVVWSEPEKIGLEESGELYWARNPEVPEEQKVVWCRAVSEYLEGELPNGMDDNGNGLIDEKGLSFSIDRNAVTIKLTLDEVTSDGERITKTSETVVTCRNPEALAP